MVGDSRREATCLCGLLLECKLGLVPTVCFPLILSWPRVAGLYVASRLRVLLVQLVRGASPEDKERLLMDEYYS